MTCVAFRQLKDGERQLLDQLLSSPFPGRDELVDQIRESLVEECDSDGGLEFRVQSGVKPADVEYRVPTEGEYEDSDGVTVHVLLHVVDGIISELEVFREDGQPVIGKRDQAMLRVFSPH